MGQIVRHGAYPTRLEDYRAAVQIDLPQPYDFHRSTFRFRTFGEDAASVWHDDGLYRVLRSGRVVRIAADGVRGDGPFATGDRAEVLHWWAPRSIWARSPRPTRRSPPAHPGSGRRSSPTRSNRW